MYKKDDARRASATRPRATPTLSPMASHASASSSLAVIHLPVCLPSPRQGTRLSRADSSGIVDIAALAQGLAAIPTTPLVPMLVNERPTTDARSDRSTIWAMTGVTALAIAALVGVAVTHAPAPVVVHEAAPAAPVLALAEDANAGRDATILPDEALVIVDEPAASEPEQDDASEVNDERPQDVPSPVPKAKPKPRAKPKPSTTAEPAASKPAASKPATSKPAASGAMPSVDCILDPKSCDLGSSKPEAVTPVAPSTSSLPEKLGTAALRSALAGAKTAAQTCGPRHGAAKGTQVQVKLSIVGATGKVSSAAAQGDHAGSAVGLCVAQALSKAVFPRFSATQQGVVYPIRL